MEDQFDINFEAEGKKYAGTVYPDQLGDKIHYQLSYQVGENGKSALIFMERGDTADEAQSGWVQRIIQGEQPFLSAEFLQAAGEAIDMHDPVGKE